MAVESKIGWTRSTFNPWIGCVEVSPECDECYAREMMDTRYGRAKWGKDEPRVRTSAAYWRQPHTWNRQAVKSGEFWPVFCGSLCDVMEFREDLDPWRADLCRVIRETPALTWLLLTKRPQNFRRLLPPEWIEHGLPPNVWAMATVGVNSSLWRIDALKGVPAAVHGLSIEPLLEDLPTIGEHLDGIGWAIVGAESGKKPRPMELDWVRRVRGACEQSGTAFFYKQNVISGIIDHAPLLDGVRHAEFPEARMAA